MKTQAEAKSYAWGVLFIAALAASMPLPTFAAGDPAAGEKKAAACMACHGPDGNSLADMWPKLAGQLPDYIVKQLQDFKAGRRNDEQMSPQVANLAEHDMPDIAAWFATQTIKPVASDKALHAKGELLYLKGKGRPAPVTACIGCHGPAGAGNKYWNKTWAKVPAVLAPGIGGQHAAYIEKQLLAYRAGTRNNDPARVMRDIARGLDDAEIKSLAAYVSGLSR
jgi:cytochrome c553